MSSHVSSYNKFTNIEVRPYNKFRGKSRDSETHYCRRLFLNNYCTNHAAKIKQRFFHQQTGLKAAGFVVARYDGLRRDLKNNDHYLVTGGTAQRSPGMMNHDIMLTAENSKVARFEAAGTCTRHRLAGHLYTLFEYVSPDCSSPRTKHELKEGPLPPLPHLPLPHLRSPVF